MVQPLGFIDENNPFHVYKLHKALYSLKQALRAWYHELQTYLGSIGFVNSRFDTSLFIYSHNGFLLLLLIYVDDIMLTRNSLDLIPTVIH